MTENIYLFVPNIIGYFRIVFAFVSFYYISTDYVAASTFYLLSGLLDHLDGIVARMLNQCSKFGALLDQVTDRIITMCLCAALCHFYPDYMLLFQLAMALDIFSHWFHTYSTVLKRGESHKNIDLCANPVLRLYYHNEFVLTTLCVANELFFCMLYLVHFTPGPVLTPDPLSTGLFTTILYITAPLALVKSFINVIQLLAAAQSIVIIDQQVRAGVGNLQFQ